MKIISLNTWGGFAGKEALLDFFRTHADTDVFCLQEIWAAPYEHLEGASAGGRELKNEQIMVYGKQEIEAALPDHRSYFRPHFEDHYGLLILVKKSLTILEEGERFVHRDKGYKPEGDIGQHARNIQYVTVAAENGPVTIINFHGLWAGKGVGKIDTPERLIQSERLAAFLMERTEPLVLMGDFNLLPDTESLAMLEKAGLKNLIKEYGITSTRTSHYTKPEKYADYALVSPTVTVRSFEVLPDEVSDHAPLKLELS